ncbi:MAG TPA: 30S ribosome-binding factor RbfA [Thermoleophilia bacterium]|nr:30S ribosome-binding factor RbfA [Thermoleophilia bacterium]
MGHRLLKVNEAVREVLSETLAEGLKDPRIGFVTVTSVETSADLRHAKVFVSVLGGQREREQTLAGLRSSHGYLQERVAEAIRLKRTPQLEFVYDESVARGMRIQELLQHYESEVRTPADEGEAVSGTDEEPYVGADDVGSGDETLPSSGTGSSDIREGSQ